jgi:hypothetical protein
LTYRSNKKKVWRLPKIPGSILKYRVPPLWPTYIGGRTTFAKAYGMKVTCYGEHVGEHIGNLGNILGIQRKHGGNTLETWENEIKSFPHLQKNLKGKKQGTLSTCLGLPIGCMNFFFHKEFITIFGLG